MAATTTTNSLSSLIDTKAAAVRKPASASPQCVSLPTLAPLPPVPSQSRVSRTAAYCRKLARNVVAMATGEVSTAELVVSQEVETPEIMKTITEAWDKVEDKYAVSSLAAAGLVFLCGSAGAISAIDRLPLVPVALELVGIGYTGWFAYRNLVFKPDREALTQKIKDIYKEITGSS